MQRNGKLNTILQGMCEKSNPLGGGRMSRGKKMNKLVKGILAILGVTLVGSVIVKERNTLNEIRKDLWNIRWFDHDENKLKDERKK